MSEEFVPDDSKRRIVAAANRRKSDGLIIVGPRHCDMTMRALFVQLGGYQVWRCADQGFVDQFGTFHTREEAHVIATRQGQIIRRCGGDETRLYSENLY